MSVGFNRARLAAAGLAVAGCIVAATAGSASAASLTKVRIAYNPNPSNTTVIVAEQQGYFKKNGINAVLTPSESTASLIQALGKQFDIVNVTAPSVLQASEHGQNLTVVGGEDLETKALPDTYLIAAKDITSIKQLKGAKIGIPTIGSGNLYEAAVIALEKAGISKNDVTFLQVPFTDQASDLANGTIQAADTIVPFQGQLLGEGFTNLGDPMLAVTDNTPAFDLGWGASGTWAAANPTVIKGFMKAQEEADTWIKSHKAATERILEKSFQLPAQAADSYPLYQYFSFGVKSNYLTDWVAPMKKIGDLSASFSPNLKKLIF